MRSLTDRQCAVAVLAVRCNGNAEMSKEGSLGGAGASWALGGEKGILHKPLGTGSYEGAVAFVARCHEHEQCSKQWLFSKQGRQMAVSQQGDHAGT